MQYVMLNLPELILPLVLSNFIQDLSAGCFPPQNVDFSTSSHAFVFTTVQFASAGSILSLSDWFLVHCAPRLCHLFIYFFILCRDAASSGQRRGEEGERREQLWQNKWPGSGRY